MPEFGVLDFERPIFDLEEKVKELRKMMEFFGRGMWGDKNKKLRVYAKFTI
jgi:hypothetical protein